MKSLNSLYFPETILPRHLRNCLLLLPDTLHLLQPVEAIQEDTAERTTDDIFMEQDICQVHTPSLLGKDRERFIGLLHEIKTRRDNFAEQLSGLTLAHLSEKMESGDHNSQVIQSTLLGGKAPVDNQSSEESKEAALWQARLMLALAEILDKEEAELASSLSTIGDDEMALFQELKGEIEDGDATQEENPFAELERIKANLSQPRPGTVKRRLQAWKSFYASGVLPDNFWFWMTSQEEAAELLITEYETQAGRDAVPLLLLDLPEQMSMRDEDALKSIRNFQEKADTVRKEIIRTLTAIINKEHLNIVDPVALLPDAGVLARDWNDLIEYHFPEKDFGRKKLDLQFLANISLTELVGGGEKGKICHSIVACYRD